MSTVSRSAWNFEEHGFVALRGFLDETACSDLVQNVERFVRDVVPGIAADQVYYETKGDESTLKQVQQLGEHDEFFRALQHEGAFREVAEQLLAGPVVPKNVQYFNKPAAVGKPTPPHQDGYYFMLDPCEAVTMWLAIDPADKHNGCVCYVPGSHAEKMREHGRTTTLGFSQGIVDYPTAHDKSREVAMVARPGDLLVHQAMTIHCAGANATQRSRRALGFIYYSERAREDSQAHAAYQQALAAELRAAKKI